MAVLSTEKRKSLPSDAFALPEEKEFPLTDVEHGRKAIQLLPQSHTTPEEKAEVRRKVREKFPQIRIAKKGGR